MKIQDFLKSVNYKITEGSEYLWKCYGDNAYSISHYQNNLNDIEYEVNCVFDTVSELVYNIELIDYDENIGYRWIHPDYKENYLQEAENNNANEYEMENIHNIELCSDIMNKIDLITIGEKYDTRIKVPLDLDDDLLFELMKLAHEKDITLNQLVLSCVEASIEKYEQDLINNN
jgi:hypothetical protein